MDVLSDRLRAVRARIAAACENSGRSTASVRLLAVSKQQPAEAIHRLAALGQRAFGENRLQEALAKQAELAGESLQWHFIGPVQSNKTRDIATHFSWVQSADREKVIRRLADQRPPDLPPLNLCLQVNIDNEPQKAGVAPDAVAELAKLASREPRLHLRGLMCLPTLTDDRLETRDSFLRLAALANTVRASGIPLDTLSMGMSGDLELAIECGSTLVRIGTDLFGPRGGQAGTHGGDSTT
jgi:pyridoxal phosphate enzyme (YggS family)